MDETDQSRSPSGEFELPEGVITELPDEDIEFIPYNPLNATQFSDHDVEIKGYKVRTHSVNNFPKKFAIIVNPGVKTRGARSILEDDGRIYEPVFKELHLEQLADALRFKYPKLYARMAAIATDFYEAIDDTQEAIEIHGRQSPQFEEAKAKEFLPPEQFNYNEYFFSKGYDALALIAQEYGLNVDLKKLA